MRVILIQPQNPENAGFIARSMNAFGFHDLRFVSPSFNWDKNSPAYKTACGSHFILDQVTILDRFYDAIQDSHHVIGFSRRHHNTQTSHLTLDDWTQSIPSLPASQIFSLVFGSEDFGLSSDIIAKCTQVVEIPQFHKTLSLNLSHAVGIVLYSLYSRLSTNVSNDLPVENQTVITQSQVIRMMEAIVHLKNNEKNLLPGKQKRHHEILLNFLQRSHITKDEFSVLMSYFNKME